LRFGDRRTIESRKAIYFDVRRERIIGFAERQRLPAIYQFREYAVAGGLLSTA
jgi:hypothetical protein